MWDAAGLRRCAATPGPQRGPGGRGGEGAWDLRFAPGEGALCRRVFLLYAGERERERNGRETHTKRTQTDGSTSKRGTHTSKRGQTQRYVLAKSVQADESLLYRVQSVSG